MGPPFAFPWPKWKRFEDCCWWATFSAVRSLSGIAADGGGVDLGRRSNGCGGCGCCSDRVLLIPLSQVTW